MKTNRRNYYRILHIQPDAPADIIKASYRTQMQKLKMHPDLGGDEWNASVLNEAYRVLSNPEKRAAYDASFLGNREGLVNAAQGSRARTGKATAEPTHPPPEVPLDMSRCAFCRTPRPPDIARLPTPFCSGCGGPLEVAGTLHAVDTARRACERMVHHAPVTVYADTGCKGIRGKIVDLSPMGLQIRTPAPLRPGSVIRICGDAVTAIGRVVFSNRARLPGQFSHGIAFITVSFRHTRGTFISENA